jgi:hypothetical protein
MGKVFLCSLLVLLTPVDDAWARATPQPDDDAWATENNDFLPRTANDLAPAPAAPAPGAGLPAAATAAAGQAGASVLRAPSAPNPLDLLMALRC